MPHNVDSVIADIEDLKDDLHDNMESAAKSSMRAVLTAAKVNVEDDADWNGNLRRALTLEARDEGGSIVVSVHTDADIAPYAPFVEFGTGSRRLTTAPQADSEQIPPDFDAATSAPPDFPYKAPSMGPGLVANIVEWVETKPIVPEGDLTDKELGFQIAARIAEQGTYAHPFLTPAWFENEPLVKQSMKNAVWRTFR